MILDEVQTLPTTLKADQVAEVWGCSTWAVYAMVKEGTCPVAPLKLGRNLRWGTAPVLRSVGIERL